MICPQCNKEFYQTRTDKKYKHCSVECASKAREIINGVSNVTVHHQRLMRYPHLRKVWRQTLEHKGKLHTKIDNFLYEELYQEMKK